MGLLTHDSEVDRALLPADRVVIPPPLREGTFEWVMRPPDGEEDFFGVCYSDGSRLDGPDDETARNGWSFVVVGLEGKVIAIARGVPPDWVLDIPACEAWALYQAALRALPGTKFNVDCRPCLQAAWGGRAYACGGNKVHARVHGLMLTPLDGVRREDLIWVPAHTAAHDVGKKLCSDGKPLTEVDRMANGLADEHAKKAVEAHRLSESARKQVAAEEKRIRELAMWLGKATDLVNNREDDKPARDANKRSRETRRAATPRTTAMMPSMHRSHRQIMVPSAIAEAEKRTPRLTSTRLSPATARRLGSASSAARHPSTSRSSGWELATGPRSSHGLPRACIGPSWATAPTGRTASPGVSTYGGATTSAEPMQTRAPGAWRTAAVECTMGH